MSIIDEILEPESQDNPHHWAATFGGHAWIALGPWGLLAIAYDKWTAAWLTPILYFLCWEGLQWVIAKRRTKAVFWDCVLDTIAVAFGCYAATLTGYGHQMPAVACWAASVGVMVTGWQVRVGR